jgi:uncharacterized protein (UPF0216 family)
MYLHQSTLAAEQFIFLPYARKFSKKGWIWKKWKLGRGFRVTAVTKMYPEYDRHENAIILQKIAIPKGDADISPEELEELKKMVIEKLNEEARDHGWRYYSLPAHEVRDKTLKQITDVDHRLLVQECLRVLDAENNNWHNDMLELGAKGRRQVYRTMPTTFHVFAVRTK